MEPSKEPMSDTIFDPKILYLARNRVGLGLKQAFVDANALGGQGGDAQAAASAPPQGGGTSPMAPPAAMPAMGADPTAQALDPAAGGPNPLEARIAALEAGNAGGAKPGGGGKGGGKGEQELVLKQILNMLSILFDTLGIPVPTQAMIPDSAAATAGGAAQAQAQPPAQDPSQGAGGPSNVLGQPPGPPQPVAPMTSVLGSPGAQPGGDPSQSKSSAVKAAASWNGIAVTPQMLHSVVEPTLPQGKPQIRSAADARRILGLK